MINFNIPYKVINLDWNFLHISGDGEYSNKCSQWLSKSTHVKKVLLTTSCTDALEMSAILSNINPGDEVIAPSYTFVSTVNAFVLRGAKIVFVDIKPDTMNIDEKDRKSTRLNSSH
jgi:dTDP-4-amino-4,6-dideoxygalactose transaminase